jgi:two-component system, NarL family, response regulator NreC
MATSSRLAAFPHRTAVSGRGAGQILPTAPPISVLLADDHAVLRRTLRLLLESEQNVEVVGEASDLPAVLELLNGSRPQVLVMDLDLPGGSSIQALSRMRVRVPETQIVVLTMEESPIFSQQVLAAGAVGFVAKRHADSELPAAVQAAARGERYLSPRVAGRLDMLQQLQSEDKLSPREIEILRLIALGFTSVEVARQLHLSPRTVETHRAHILRKLGLSTRAELVSYALGRGLLDT